MRCKLEYNARQSTSSPKRVNQPTNKLTKRPMTTQPPSRPPTDYRAYRRKTDRNLAWAVVLLLVGGGGALIAFVYGGGAAILGVTCLLAGAGMFGLVWLILTLLERWAEK